MNASVENSFDMTLANPNWKGKEGVKQNKSNSQKHMKTEWFF